MRKIISIAAVLLATAIPTGRVAAAQTQTERFSFIDTSTTAPKPVFSVIATGAFTDGGTATMTSKGVLDLTLSAGTITFRLGNDSGPSDKTETVTTCAQSQTKDGSYSIVGGTGAYKGITGSGHSTEDDTFVEPLIHGSCSNSFAAAQALVTASGPVLLP
jgi:hypothetical protein